jgi:hypothetical protein
MVSIGERYRSQSLGPVGRASSFRVKLPQVFGRILPCLTAGLQRDDETPQAVRSPDWQVYDLLTCDPPGPLARRNLVEARQGPYRYRFFGLSVLATVGAKLAGRPRNRAGAGREPAHHRRPSPIRRRSPSTASIAAGALAEGVQGIDGVQ